MTMLANLTYQALTFGGALALTFGIITADARPAAALLVNVNSSALNGSSARLDFQLLDGDLTANNSATLSALNTNGTLQGFDCTLGCAGGPPFVINDALGLGQFIQDLVLGTALSFDLGITDNFAGGDADLLVLNLLDPVTNFTLVDTNLDALAGPVPYQDALLVFNLQTRQFLFPSVTSPVIGVSTPLAGVPEPNIFLLLMGGALVVLSIVARQRGVSATGVTRGSIPTAQKLMEEKGDHNENYN